MGRPTQSLSDAERGLVRNHSLGFVYQFHHLLMEFTALENVAMPLLIRRMPPAGARAAAAGILKEVGLGERLDHTRGERACLPTSRPGTSTATPRTACSS